jgi:putative phosphoserine phosphatase/1-acylglycerol-3-phosphate O-acyltransferase
MTAAAFVDLDRTLLSGASGPVLTAALRSAKLVPQSVPGESLLYRVFNTVGETLPSMLLARQGAAAMKGKSQRVVRDAVRTAIPELAALVQPFARQMMERHRAAGDKLVLATTTPYDFVEEFARSLGFDDVIGTRYAVDAGGLYTGELDGRFVWSGGKLASVVEWCAANGVDISASAAYSDSVYDSPLLEAVGSPHAVNPDARLQVLAAARRWPIVNFDVSPGVVKVPVIGTELQKLALTFARPELIPFAKFAITGTENIPADGPAILVGNHRSYFDVFAVSLTVAKTGRTVRFLGPKEGFDAPVIGQLAAALGGIRVERGTGSDAPLEAASAALEAGEMVAIMPQGTIPRGRAFFDPVLKGRWGAARLAARTGAPVIPLGLWGTERVWPRSSQVPMLWNVTNPPKVSVTVGAEVALNRDGVVAGDANTFERADSLADENTARMMSAISALLPPEARERREPTEAELRAALPSNYKGDLNAEDTRRPGRD